jgi:hypothetical protein
VACISVFGDLSSAPDFRPAMVMAEVRLRQLFQRLAGFFL